MTAWFRRLPIRHKLVTMIMLTSSVVLVLASLGYVINDFVRARADVRRDLFAQAQLVLDNSTAAIAYRDVAVARETLRTLTANPYLRLACLYDERRALLSEFKPSGDARSCPASAPPPGSHFTLTSLDVTADTLLGGKPAGAVMLRSDLRMITGRLRTQLLIVTLMLALALAVALLLSSRLHALVSEPVMSLAATAAEVSAKGDYALRAQRTTDDEVGTLVDGFNRVLERIQSREAELSEANAELRREVAERRRAEHERAELLVREREANRLKDEFLATLSHELRTPLNAILGWTRLLRANGVPPAGLDRALEKIERNAHSQARLIEDLLEVSRIASGKLRIDFRPCDLLGIVNTAIDSIRPTAETRGVTIHRDFQTVSLPTAGDPDRLQQVAWNLLSNAVKFTPEGGTVTVGLRRDQQVDELRVADTGIGIDSAFLPNVFDMFRQADASSTRTYGGLGLGLSIVRQLVELHGGSVQAQSEGRDKGSVFTVRLPVRAASIRTADAPDAADAAPLLKGTDILLVDDDPDTRELLESALESAGASVRCAASAQEALACALARPPDVLISDIAMPGEDGYSLMRQVVDSLGPRTPRVTIALSAYASDGDRQRARAAGFHHYVAKPVDPRGW
jgi:signal transduction histidine kinase/CheY-like chemotaxis protein